MKKGSCFLFFLSLFSFQFLYSQVAINTTGNNANSSAMLDVESTTKGMLIPRMSTAQRTAIVSPATGLLVYDNTTSSFWFYSGTAWTELINSNSSSVNLWAQSGSNIYNSNSGNVGVGISNPGFLLQAYKNSDVWHGSMGGATGALLIGGQTNNGAVLQSVNPSNSTARDLYLQRDGGNVGIGTNNPLAKLHIKQADGTLMVEETENDYGRLEFRNTNANSFWQMNANPQTTAANARVELWNSSAGVLSTPFVITGNGRTYFSGPLAPLDNAGTSGQVLQSNGSSAPSWVTATNSLYTNTYHLDMDNTVVNLTSGFTSSYAFLPGLSLNFTTASNARAIIIFGYNAQTESCIGCGYSSVASYVFLDDVGVSDASFVTTIPYTKKKAVTGMATIDIPPGSHNLKLRAWNGGGSNLSIGADGYMDVIIIKE